MKRFAGMESVCFKVGLFSLINNIDINETLKLCSAFLKDLKTFFEPSRLLLVFLQIAWFISTNVIITWSPLKDFFFNLIFSR